MSEPHLPTREELAGFSPHQRVIAILRGALAEHADPEVVVALAEALIANGLPDAARARARHEALVEARDALCPNCAKGVPFSEHCRDEKHGLRNLHAHDAYAVLCAATSIRALIEEGGDAPSEPTHSPT